MKIALKIALVLVFLAPMTALGEGGDTYYVNANNVNLRKTPNVESPILRGTEFGDEFIELKRENGWVYGFPLFGDGVEGWIKALFLDDVRPYPDLETAQDPAYEKFKYELLSYNEIIKAFNVTGYYMKVEKGGEREIWIFVTNKWLRLNQEERASNLHTLMGLWDKVNGKEGHIILQLVDTRGNRFMRTSR